MSPKDHSPHSPHSSSLRIGDIHHKLLLIPYILLALLLPVLLFSDTIQFSGKGSGTEGDPGSTSFLGLTDTPDAYTSSRAVTVNSGGTALELTPMTDANTANALVKRDAQGDINVETLTAEEELFTPKVTTTGTAAGSLKLEEADASGTDSVTLAAPTSVTSTYSLLLPTSPPTATTQSLICGVPSSGVSTCSWGNADPTPASSTNISKASITNVTAPGPYNGDSQYSWQKAFDDSLSTMYHSVFQAFPIDFVMELNTNYNVSGMIYDTRDDNSNGRCTSYEIYVSTDGATWGTANSFGTWADDGNIKTINFTAETGDWVRFRCLADPFGGLLSIVELTLKQTP